MINRIINNLNNSAYFAGVMMILLNLGSRYIVMEISDTQEQFLSNIIVRRLLVFTIFFTATRDVYTSFILTAVFIIFVTGLFNEKSKYCILPKSMIYTPNEGRLISNEEIEYAQKIIDISEKQKNNKDNHNSGVKLKDQTREIIYNNNLKALQIRG